MKKAVIYFLSTAWVLFGFQANAQDVLFGDDEESNEGDEGGAADDSPSGSAFVSADSELAGGDQTAPTVFTPQNIIGGHLMFGAAGMSEKWGDAADMTDIEFRARFAGGIGIYFQHFFTKMVAINGGLDFVGKGYKTEYDALDRKERARLRHLEIPVGVRFNIENIRLGFDLAFSIAVYGEYWRKENRLDDNDIETDDKTVYEEHFDDSFWDTFRRFNVNPRFTAGYAIPVGEVVVVPGLLWEFELLNSAKGKYKDANVKFRQINLMLTAAVSYTL